LDKLVKQKGGPEAAFVSRLIRLAVALDRAAKLAVGVVDLELERHIAGEAVRPASRAGGVGAERESKRPRPDF